MNEAVYLDALQENETNYWYNYWYGSSKEDQEIPSWLDEEEWNVRKL